VVTGIPRSAADTLPPDADPARRIRDGSVIAGRDERDTVRQPRLGGECDGLRHREVEEHG
jgi:hypothetical protein